MNVYMIESCISLSIWALKKEKAEIYRKTINSDAATWYHAYTEGINTNNRGKPHHLFVYPFPRGEVNRDQQHIIYIMNIHEYRQMA